jgi:hypothetical protein
MGVASIAKWIKAVTAVEKEQRRKATRVMILAVLKRSNA